MAAVSIGHRCDINVYQPSKMIKSIVHFIVWAVCFQSAYALSVSIPKSVIDNAIEKKFPKEKLSIILDKPLTRFNQDAQRIELCGIWQSKKTKYAGDFCIDTQLIWNKSKGNVEIAKANIVKITLGEDKEIPNVLSLALNSTLLTLFDGTSIYHAPEIVGKHLEGIEIRESGLKLLF